jgi:hypothetical protein
MMILDPRPKETILLVRRTGLEPSQVKAWIDNERKVAERDNEHPLIFFHSMAAAP